MEPIELVLGNKPPWAREPEYAWVRRLLFVGWQDEVRVDLVKMNDQEIELLVHLPLPICQHPDLTREARTALGAWVKHRQTGSRDDPARGTGILVCSPDRHRILCQRKDYLHPNPKCRGRYSLFGGLALAGETWEEASMRELYEEISDRACADMIAARVRLVGPFHVPAVQWEGYLDLMLGMAQADDDETFDAWCQGLADGLTEAEPTVLEGEDLLRKLEKERAQPGDWFVASHGTLIEYALRYT